jgi:Response regulators consisting of a CheY-like receiver domain and a winged-helix DNA-binding domain
MKHILIVEDERNLAEGIRYNLEAEGYRTTMFGDGTSALAFLENEPVDLVVLDLMLPGMSGYAVCETLRSRELVMPILILSARSLAEDRARGFQVGADQYMQKPFDLDEFLARVRSLLAMYQRRVETARDGELSDFESSINRGDGGRGTGIGPVTARHPALPPVITFGDGAVEVDFPLLRVRRGDRATRVTPLEMKLLRYFIEHEGAIIPRRELLERVWGIPGHISTRAPDQFMRRLRKMIEEDPSAPRHLVTLRDAGYQFTAEPTSTD